MPSIEARTAKQVPSVARLLNLPRDAVLYYATTDAIRLARLAAEDLPDDVRKQMVEWSPSSGVIVTESLLVDGKQSPSFVMAWVDNDVLTDDGWLNVREAAQSGRGGIVLALIAFWYVLSHPSLSERTVESVPSGRWSKGKGGKKRKHVDPVNVIDLRRAVRRDQEAVAEAERNYQHRWIVRGHWRQQAYGPGRSERRNIYIAPHVKGPEGAPMIEREKVYRW